MLTTSTISPSCITAARWHRWPTTPEVVGDHDIGQGVFGAQIDQQVQDLGLYGNIQRRGRLVQQQYPGFGRQRAGDCDTRWRCPPES